MKLIIALIVTSWLSCFSHSDQTDKAKEIFNKISGSFITSDAVVNSLQNPLTSSGSMKTLDGSKSFSAQLSCNSEAEFLEVTVTPQPTNEVTITFTIDNNLDGEWDYSNVISGVSGVCQNGYVQCDIGTWNNCTYYLLEANTTISPQLLNTEDDKSQLFNCNCINSSCGTNLATSNKDKISRRVATRTALSMANNNPRFIASRVDTEDGVTKYYGNDISSCSDSVGNNTGFEDLISAGRSKDIDSLVSSGKFVANEQEQNSVYNMAVNQQHNNSSDGEPVKHCSTTRELRYEEGPLFDNIVSIFGYTDLEQLSEICEYSLVDRSITCGRYSTGNSNDNIFPSFDYETLCGESSNTSIEIIFEETETNHLGTGGAEERERRLREGIGNSDMYHEHISLPTCENNLTGSFIFNPDTTPIFNTVLHYTKLFFHITKNNCNLIENISNDCQDINHNFCELSEEVVDGTKILFNGVATGSLPQPTSIPVGSGNCQSLEVRDWYQRNFTYLCSSEEALSDFDLSHLREPIINDNEMVFNNGEGFDITVIKPDIELPTCQKTCEVKKEIIDTQINTTGQTSDGRIGNTRTLKVFKKCESNICPLDFGETISKQCECGGDFGSAATTMQMLRLAGQDMQCIE
ncbi:MAG: hypothetical protein RPS47_18105 [Colwellia sp.]